MLGRLALTLAAMAAAVAIICSSWPEHTYNAWSGQVTATLPSLPSGRSWYRVADTAAWMESRGNAVTAGQEERMVGTTYDVAGRSVLVLLEK